MDALKILSRSTKRSNAEQQRAFPNDVRSSQFGIDRNSTKTNDELPKRDIVPQTKKRKRHQQPLQNTAVEQDIDFFGEGKAPTESAQLPTQQKNPATVQHNADTAAYQSDQSPAEQNEQLSEARCREILRSNKIKITELKQSNNAEQATVLSRAAAKSRGGDRLGASVSGTRKRRVDVITQPLVSFHQLSSKYGVSPSIAQNLASQGFQTPTEVQLAGLPLLLRRFDRSKAGQSTNRSTEYSHLLLDDQLGINLLTVAPTGSGKTLAFLIPILEAIRRHRISEKVQNEVKPPQRGFGPLAIIVAPTKELASQIVNEARKLTTHIGVKISLVRKGMKLKPSVDRTNLDAMDANGNHEGAVVKSHILVSTPLTLIHAMQNEEKEVEAFFSVQHLVLDEADVLLDPLFQEQTLQVVDACSNPHLRLSFWSATMGSSIEDLAKSIIDKRWKSLEAEREGMMPPAAPLLRLVVGLKDSAVATIHHKLIYAATEQGKLMALRQLLRPSERSHDAEPPLIPPFLVFTQTIPRAVALHSELLYDIPQEAGGEARIAVLHADLSETARDRVMNRFRSGEIWVLITTDLLSRGVDFRGINGVVNYDFPNSTAAYVHRVGRTGRAGRQGGVAITLYAREDVPYVKSIANVIAASEQQQTSNDLKQDTGQWILNSLPNPSKNEKKKLKKRGVESRRTVGSEKSNDASGKVRISTKSGYERRLENNRRGAIISNRNVNVSSTGRGSDEDAGSAFEGLSD